MEKEAPGRPGALSYADFSEDGFFVSEVDLDSFPLDPESPLEVDEVEDEDPFEAFLESVA